MEYNSAKDISGTIKNTNIRVKSINHVGSSGDFRKGLNINSDELRQEVEIINDFEGKTVNGSNPILGLLVYPAKIKDHLQGRISTTYKIEYFKISDEEISCENTIKLFLGKNIKIGMAITIEEDKKD